MDVFSLEILNKTLHASFSFYSINLLFDKVLLDILLDLSPDILIFFEALFFEPVIMLFISIKESTDKYICPSESSICFLFNSFLFLIFHN